MAPVSSASDPQLLKPGDEMKCSTCRGWHVIEQRNTTGTENERRMLYYTCDGGLYFAGNAGTPARRPIRAREVTGADARQVIVDDPPT